jgi:hypothetical protein
LLAQGRPDTDHVETASDPMIPTPHSRRRKRSGWLLHPPKLQRLLPLSHSPPLAGDLCIRKKLCFFVLSETDEVSSSRVPPPRFVVGKDECEIISFTFIFLLSGTSRLTFKRLSFLLLLFPSLRRRRQRLGLKPQWLPTSGEVGGDRVQTPSHTLSQCQKDVY